MGWVRQASTVQQAVGFAQLCLRHQHLQLRKKPYIEQRCHGHKHGPQHQNAAELQH